MMDSVTRFAMAQREIGLAAGEAPTTRGYPPSVFSMLPRLVERAGNCTKGSITGIYTVLVEGDDTNEPISDTLRGLLDGHIVLNRKIAQQGRYPAIDVLVSLSRLQNHLAASDHMAAAAKVRALMAIYKENEDLIAIGAYQRGVNAQSIMPSQPSLPSTVFYRRLAIVSVRGVKLSKASRSWRSKLRSKRLTRSPIFSRERN